MMTDDSNLGTTQVTLPDGRVSAVSGNPRRWDGPMPLAPASTSCLTLVLAALGGPSVRSDENLTEACSVADFEDAVRRERAVANSERGDSLEDLAQQIELDRLVVILVNAGTAWDAPSAVEHGAPNHACLVASTVRDLASGELLGMFVRDPSRTHSQFMAAEQLVGAWLVPGGTMIVVSKDRGKNFSRKLS